MPCRRRRIRRRRRRDITYDPDTPSGAPGSRGGSPYALQKKKKEKKKKSESESDFEFSDRSNVGSKAGARP